ncbi:MAG: hypothetical protein RLZZ385_2758 [Pseudomonadota bacterium]|jgi:hypothetical protein
MPRTVSALLLISAFNCSIGFPWPVMAAEDDPVSRLLAERERYSQQLQVLEEDLGRFHGSLVEPLVQQARLSMALNDFDQTRSILERAVQIQRINHGLYTAEQFPLLQLQVENAVRRGDWVDANATLEHLYWLYVNKHRGMDADLIQELRNLSGFHLEAVAADVEERQAYHFRQAAQIGAVTLQVGRHVWGDQDIRLAELYYDLVKQYYLQAVAVDRGSRTGYELREVAPGSSWVRSRQTAMRGYYQSGLGLLQQTRALYRAQQPPDLEGEALATLYLADWQILFTRDAAADTYQQAYGELVEAGVEPALLTRFFAEPKVLPQPRIYTTVEAALAMQENAEVPATASRESQPLAPFHFNEWSRAFPDVQFPFPRGQVRFRDDEAWGSVLLSFSLAGLEKVSRWINGRYVTRLSVPSTLEVLQQDGAPGEEPENFAAKLHSLHFRPRLVDGIPEPARGTLHYLFSTR